MFEGGSLGFFSNHNSMISIESAQNIIALQSAFLSLSTKQVKLEQLCGYVLAQNIYTDRDYPPFHRALMDGFALCTKDYARFYKKGFLVSETIAPASSKASSLSPGTCARIMTGAPLPLKADAIIPKEEVILKAKGQDKKKQRAGSSPFAKREGEERVYFRPERIEKNQNIALQGEDSKAGLVLIPKGKRIRNADIASLASLGISRASVFSPPTCALLSTGNEIVPVDRKAAREQIRDANAPALRAHLSQYHAPIDSYCIVRDERRKIKAALQKGMKSDFVIVSGGVSKGDLDIVPQVMQEVGVDCLFHRVNVKPAKPFYFGKKKNGPIVFGLPGNNFSAQVGFKVFIEPFLRLVLGTSPLKPIKLRLGSAHKRKDKRPEYFPCILDKETGDLLQSYDLHSSGDVRGALGSSGIALHPMAKSTLPRGTQVDFLFWDSLD